MKWKTATARSSRRSSIYNTSTGEVVDVKAREEALEMGVQAHDTDTSMDVDLDANVNSTINLHTNTRLERSLDSNSAGISNISPTMQMMVNVLSITLFSWIGVLVRVGLIEVASYSTAVFPLLWAQCLGCFVMGLVRHSTLLSPALKLGLTTGLCGSITTFSSFSLGVFQVLVSPSLSRADAQTTFSLASIVSALSLVMVTFGMAMASLQFGEAVAVAWSALPTASGHVPFKHTSSVINFKGVSMLVSDLVLISCSCVSWIAIFVLCIHSGATIGSSAMIPFQTHTLWSVSLSCLLGPIGAVLRYAAGLYLNKVWPRFPLGTFLVNTVGSVIRAWGQVYWVKAGGALDMGVAAAVNDGFTGGLTTLSTLAAELSVLGVGAGALYAGSSVAVSLALHNQQHNYQQPHAQESAHAPATFDTLPYEVAQLVVARMHARDLPAAVLVCRLWRQLATPYLWRTLRIRRPVRLHLLLLRHSPRLTSHALNRFALVRSIDLSAFDTGAGKLDLQVSVQFGLLVAECVSLESLDLSGCLWVRDKDLLAITAAKKLVSLNLHGCTNITGSTLNAVFHNLPALTSVSLFGCTSISSLHFAFQPMTDPFTGKTAKPGPLESIDMRAIFSLVDINQTLIAIFKTFRHTLKHIYIPGHFLSGSDGFSCLMNIRPHIHLTTLHVDTPTNLTDISLSYLARGHVTRLESLSLAQATHLTSPSLAAFLSHSPALQYIDLSHIPSVDDHVLTTISNACQRIQSVRIKGCVKVSDVGLWALTSTFRDSLQDLALDYTGITAHGVKKALQGTGAMLAWDAGKLRSLSLSNCQGVLGTDVHHLARLIWWEENCFVGVVAGEKKPALLGAGGGRGVTIGGGELMGGVGTKAFAGVVGGDPRRAFTQQRVAMSQPVGPRAVESTAPAGTSFVASELSLTGRRTDLGMRRESSMSVSPRLTLKSVLGSRSVSGGGSGRDSFSTSSPSPSPPPSRPHSIMGVSMSSRSSTFGGLVSSSQNAVVPLIVRSSSRNSSRISVDGVMQGQTDGIRLDPTLIEFVTVKNVDRIRDL
ncbi:hypothetical protein HDU81_007309 [Chytriomyces hyalinus]|nr:hypothetical protein HDU81_007309 [Chytriomyces hyalinus]